MIIRKQPDGSYILKVIDGKAYKNMLNAHNMLRLRREEETISKQQGDTAYGGHVFDDFILYSRLFFDGIDTYVGKKPETNERHKQSVYRTKRKMDDLLKLNLNACSYFVTLTYVGNFQDYDLAQRDFDLFVKKMKKQIGDFPYMATKEHQGRGAIHFHIVVYARVDDWLIGNAWRYGYFNVKHIKDTTTPEKISNYFTGYLLTLEKDNPLVQKGKKLLFYSRHLKKSVAISAKDNDTFQKVVKHFQDNVDTLQPIEQYRSRFHGFVDVYRITL